ncbi:hypothetical protein AKO1_005271 [Acrasis kona]|uniref:RNA helicase n=1 Tax=Acrasis kona TaxID=1008807 RepID=A0AAW2YLN2_9EUKA
MHELRAPNPHVFDDLYDSRNPQISNKHSDVAKDRFRTTFSKVDASSFGFRPETAEQSLKFIAKLGEYEVPEHLTRLTELARIGTQEDYDNELHRVVTAEFNLNTATDLINSCTHTKRYKSVFQMLLYLEELQMKIDIRTYDLFDIKLEIDFHRRELFRITVPGLAEGRPSVMQGDQIFVVDKESNEVHQGYAHVCAMDHVLCSFSDQVSDKKIYDVQFTFTRSTLRAMHRALENGFLFDMLIDRETWGHRLRVDKKELQNKVEGMDLADKRLNKKQAQLVELLAHRRMSLPIVLFGPPGTGKTSSLVEAIHQLLIKDPEARILICTPSNSSADLICVRLHRLSAIARDSMLRLNAFARKLSSIADEEIKPYCVLDEKDQFTFPMLSVLREKRVIITTLMSSSYLYSFGLSKHFTHIVIDECGQSMEPETIVPLLTSNSDAVILFAGDPRQLGPIIRSPMAIQCGMDISLLERITELHEKESPCCHLIRLHETYRSHPSIMNLYSKTFYEGSLVCRSDKSITHSLLSWKGFKRNKHTHPILFKHTSGLESRTADSPSWFNDDEAEVVMDTALSLLTQKLNLTVEDIGIITPYRKQVEKIRAKINSNPATRGIQIGTVEVYQGKEKRAIIISTVRSQQKYITFDDKFKLGFLKNPKRLNVAISRAQAALVIVGNAQLLCLDENWKKVIDACVHLNCYDGPKIVPLVVNEHDLVENQEVMNPDQEWRGDAL